MMLTWWGGGGAIIIRIILSPADPVSAPRFTRPRACPRPRAGPCPRAGPRACPRPRLSRPLPAATPVCGSRLSRAE